MTALIPFWDLANHDNGELSTDFDPATQATSCMAHKDFKSGDQFTIFYGMRTNVDLVCRALFQMANLEYPNLAWLLICINHPTETVKKS
jgi:hypothetical protein